MYFCLRHLADIVLWYDVAALMNYLPRCSTTVLWLVEGHGLQCLQYDGSPVTATSLGLMITYCLMHMHSPMRWQAVQPG